MALRCITKEKANKLKEGIKAGDFNIAKMMEMESKERRAIFEKYVDKETSLFLNTSFEKAMVSARVEALKDWATQTFKGEKKSTVKDITEKIDNLKDQGLLTGEQQDAFVEDLLRHKLGFYLTAEETDPIIKMSDELQALSGDKSAFGTPTLAYFKKRKELMDYIDSLNPSSRGKVLTSIIGRLTMLFSFKSPLTNIIGNTVNGLNEAAVRRMSENQYQGLNDKMFSDYRKFALQVFKETGYDLSRMQTITADQRIAGEELITSQGKGAIRAIGRKYEDVYKYIMGLPDIAYAGIHFVDTVSLGSMKLARKEGIIGRKNIKNRAKEIAKDAIRIEPQTDEGKLLRGYAISAAEKGTYTDQNFSAKVSKAFRQMLNTMSGDLRLGDLNIPFAHVPATVVQRSVEASGITSLYDGFKLGQAYKNKDVESIRKYSSALVRAGWGMLVAYILMSLIDPDDFVGEYADYNPNERKLIEAGVATYNSLKIGDKYYSLDYIAPFSGPILGMLNAKKYGKNPLDKITKYLAGVAGFVTRIPGYETVMESLEAGRDLIKRYGKQEINYKEEAQDAALGSVDFISSRVVPALISDFAKAMDDYERQVDYSGPESILQKIQAKIPVLRKNLPQKVDMFGNPIKTQNPAASIFAGSRFKVGVENDVLDELNRLAAQSQLPTLTDIQYTSSRIKQLKQQIGSEKFDKALKYFTSNWYKKIDKEIHSKDYQKKNDQERKQTLNNIRANLLDETLKKFHYKKPKK